MTTTKTMLLEEEQTGADSAWQPRIVEKIQKAKNSKIIKFYTPAEYLALEESAPQRHEYTHGEVRLMAGGTTNHNRIVRSAVRELERALEAHPCEVFFSDVRLHISNTELFTYPDVMVVCGQLEYVAGRDDTVSNPLIIIEVLSESTRRYDRGSKFAAYRQIPSLQEYVVIEQTHAHIECYRRSDTQTWIVESFDSLTESLALQSIGVEIPLAKIYHKVEWPA